MQSVNIHEAKTRFSKLLEEVQKGEEIIIEGGAPDREADVLHARSAKGGAARQHGG